MTADAHTETIAHFIGVMQLYVDEARLRTEYDKFKALEKAQEEAGYAKAIALNIQTGHRLEGYNPNTNIKLAPDGGLEFFSGPAAQWFFGLPKAMPVSLGGIPYPENPVYPPVEIGGRTKFDLIVPPASSVFTYNYQASALNDNDLMTYQNVTGFVGTHVLRAELDALVELAESAKAFDILPLDLLQDGYIEYAHATAEEVAVVSKPAEGPFQISIMVGADAQGTFVDGVEVEEYPDWTEHMPVYHQIDTDEDDIEEEPASPSRDDTVSPFHVEDGHAVVSGANIAVNDAHIASAWLDAPVFAVQGSVVNIDAISQVNVLMDRDVMPGYSGDTTSEALNVAQMLTSSSNPQEQGNGQSNGGSPFHWEVTRIEGDIIQVNWLQQYTFSTDFDMTEIAFTGANTFISMGENLIVNAASLLELGFYYDLIIIGGDMINLSMISQSNILIDDDDVAYVGNAADMFSGNDNLVYNSASLTSIGMDSYGELTQPFQNALDRLADGEGNIPGAVARDPLFDGNDTLSVLYIDGDFTTLNLIDQTNIVGDADQVHMLQEAIAEATGGDVTVTTGSNALLNTATVAEYGMDSTILSGGEVYSDALIYQAEFVDTDADPTGVAMTTLTSEAVAFLAEDMVEIGPVEGDIAAPIATGDAASADVMQTVLA